MSVTSVMLLAEASIVGWFSLEVGLEFLEVGLEFLDVGLEFLRLVSIFRDWF